MSSTESHRSGDLRELFERPLVKSKTDRATPLAEGHGDRDEVDEQVGHVDEIRVVFAKPGGPEDHNESGDREGESGDDEDETLNLDLETGLERTLARSLLGDATKDSVVSEAYTHADSAASDAESTLQSDVPRLEATKRTGSDRRNSESTKRSHKFGSVLLVVPATALDSPVRMERSNLRSLEHWMRRTSAGTLVPSVTLTMSPETSSEAGSLQGAKRQL